MLPASVGDKPPLIMNFYLLIHGLVRRSAGWYSNAYLPTSRWVSRTQLAQLHYHPNLRNYGNGMGIQLETLEAEALKLASSERAAFA